jgi:hypothetical protein
MEENEEREVNGRRARHAHALLCCTLHGCMGECGTWPTAPCCLHACVERERERGREGGRDERDREMRTLGML